MKNIIKKSLMLLLINLLVPIAASSQITLNSTEAKITSLIFLEHEKLSIENPLLKEQISSLEELNKLYEQSDSIQKKEIKIYEEKVASDAKKIEKLKKTNKSLIIGSSIGGTLLFILGLILWYNIIFILVLLVKL